MANCIANQEKVILSLRDSWNRFLPTALRYYPAYDSVEAYQLNPQIYVYEPSNVKHIIIWITGNAFMFNEPESHHSLLRFLAETTQSRIFALSHRKIPEFSYRDIQNDIIASLDYLKDTDRLSGRVPVIVVGDSSGALLVTQLLSHILEKTTVEQILLIAPILDMGVFLEDQNHAIESFPMEVQAEISNQNQMMRFIATLLYKNGEKIEPAIEALRNIRKPIPKTHLICFEYDIFYPQALQLQADFDKVTIDCREKSRHGDYLLKTVDENEVNQPFLLNWEVGN